MLFEARIKKRLEVSMEREALKQKERSESS